MAPRPDGLQCDTKPQWFGSAASDGSNRFFGRLAELWQIHSALWSSEFPVINSAESRPLAIRFRAENEERSTKLRAGAGARARSDSRGDRLRPRSSPDTSQLANLVEHARTVLAGKLEQGAQMAVQEAQLLDTLYVFEFGRGNYREARRITERLLAFNTEKLGEEHSNTFACLGCLGRVLRKEGDFAGSLAAHERALAHYQSFRLRKGPRWYLKVSHFEPPEVTHSCRNQLAAFTF
jgi:hypothetical protein